MVIIGAKCLVGVLNEIKADFFDLSKFSLEEVDRIFDSYVTAASMSNKLFEGEQGERESKVIKI